MTSMKKKVIVCGAGMAGLSAAVSASESGAAVTVLEKASGPGGSFQLSGGSIWTYADLGAFMRDIPDGDPSLQELVHSSAEVDRSWLEKHGVRLSEPEVVLGRGLGRRSDPQQAIGALVDAVHRNGGQFVFQTGLDSLVMEGGRVVAVDAVDGSGSVRRWDADSVVLATGGFQGNTELVSRHVVKATDNLYLRAAAWSTGDSFKAALGVGAAVTSGLDTFYGHAMLAPPTSFVQHQFQDVSQYYGASAVAVNMSGQRFIDETWGTGEEVLNQALAQQPRGRGWYIVDHAMAQEESRPGRGPTRVILDRARGFGALVEAQELSGLVDQLAGFGVPAGSLGSTLEEFNQACKAQRGSELLPPRIHHQIPLSAPPFYAVPVKASITFTMGGLAIDDRGRVMRRAGGSSPMAKSISDIRDFRRVPIGGLFAAGCDVGGVSSGGYAGGLATALVTGRAAGHEASVRN